ncbi:MAG: hypothetical protein AAB678_00340 [Patescibacteria group bacterium]
MINLNPVKKAEASVAIFALLVVIIAGIIWPTVGYIGKINNDTSDLRIYLEKKYESAKSLKKSVKKIDEVRAGVESFPQHLFHPGDELKLITILENLAAENKINQRVVNSNLDKLTGEAVRVSLIVAGDYQNFWRYLRQFEKLGLFLNIERLYLVPSASRDLKTRQVSAEINFSLYVNK